MKANELMIGNYVQDKSGEVVDVLEVLTSMILKKANGSLVNTKTITSPLSAYSPIPLTEDWLLKFGCIKQQITNTKMNYWNKGLDFSVDVELTFVKDELLYYYLLCNQFRRVSIQYVHQLQNLYFALTQTHLKTN